MDAVTGVGAARFRYSPHSRVVPVRLYRPKLYYAPPKQYPNYSLNCAAGKEALERVKRANLAMAAAVYCARALGPV